MLIKNRFSTENRISAWFRAEVKKTTSAPSRAKPSWKSFSSSYDFSQLGLNSSLINMSQDSSVYWSVSLTHVKDMCNWKFFVERLVWCSLKSCNSNITRKYRRVPATLRFLKWLFFSWSVPKGGISLVVSKNTLILAALKNCSCLGTIHILRKHLQEGGGQKMPIFAYFQY